MNTTRVTLTYSDVRGKRAQIVVYFDDSVIDANDALIQGLVDVINACVHPINLHVEISKAVAFAGSLGTGGYNTVQDKCYITLLDEENDAHTVQIPGPKETIFGANGRLLDVTDTAVSDWSTNVLGGPYTGRGTQDLVTLEKGYRSIARRRNKR